MEPYLPTAQPLNQSEWKAVRRRAIASKDPICAICGKWIDVEAPAFSPLAVEVDHIVPRARGGDIYSLENLQLTHSRCNRQKGTRMADDYLDETVTNPVPISNPW